MRTARCREVVESMGAQLEEIEATRIRVFMKTLMLAFI